MANLVTKRFARAAALPFVGEEETLLCFLPLYHTFGRYLELLGMLFWGGTYVFAGNPSLDGLAAGLRTVEPTGLISIPIRWAQLESRAREAAGEAPSPRPRAPRFVRSSEGACGGASPPPATSPRRSSATSRRTAWSSARGSG